MKKKHIIGILVFILIILIAWYISFDKAIIRGYYDKEEHYDPNGWQDYTDYCKYYYSEEYDKVFSKNKKYSLVRDEDISNIKSYFNNFSNWMSLLDRSDEYDFKLSNITSGDYVYINDREGEKIGDSYYEKYEDYTVYFYDTEQHTLYYIHSNI